MEKQEIQDDVCWVCGRTREELKNLNIDLIRIKGMIYTDHTICRACEDIIMELCIKIDDESIQEKVRETVKNLLE